MQAETTIRRSSLDDLDGIVALYKAVGKAGGGIARAPDEVTGSYVSGFLEASIADGIALVATDSAGNIVAEIHAHTLGPRTFAHVLGDLTVAVHPSWQGKGVGRKLFNELLAEVLRDMPHILRVELVSRETNRRAIAMYESLGFRAEGRMTNRIRLEDGSLDADIPMSWHRPASS
jgi:putative acetyltransferase